MSTDPTFGVFHTKRLVLSLITMLACFGVGGMAEGDITTVLEYETIGATASIAPSANDPSVTPHNLIASSGLRTVGSSTFNFDSWDPASTTFEDAVLAEDRWSWGFVVSQSEVTVNLTTMDIRLDRSGTGPDDFEIRMRLNDGPGVTILNHDYADGSSGVEFLNVDISALGKLAGGDVVNFTLAAFNSEGPSGTFDLETLSGQSFGLIVRGDTFSEVSDTTFDDTDKHAWGANTGWISFRHNRPSSPEGIVFGGAFLAGLAYAPNFGWISFGDAAPENGYSYENAGTDHGVNHDGAGNLSGYAYSGNIGWINFGWAASSNPNRPRLDLLTGVFSGYAYSGNTGWINLGTGLLRTTSMYSADSDEDDMADHWEWSNFGGIGVADTGSDADNDGVLDKDEYAAGTDPQDAASYLGIVSQSYNAGDGEFTLQFTTTPRRLYRIEYDDELGPTPGEPANQWINSSLGTFAPDAGGTTTKVVTFPSARKRFFRAIAIRPLPVTP